MRIITYADPFRLKENEEVWKLITSHPHYCASDTLVQGLISFYGRESFGVIRPLQDLMDTYMDLYTKNPVNDMNLYLEVVNAIRSWPDSPLKQSFMFNKSYVVDAVRLLMPLGFDASKVDKTLLSEEQRKLLDLYEVALESDCYDAFRILQRKRDRDFQEAVRVSASREILYQIDNNQAIITKLANRGINIHKWTIGQAKDAAQIAIQELEETPGSDKKIIALRAAIDACSFKNDAYYSTIIIHGVHRFTPEIVYLLKNLDQVLKINIVFLIPYADGLPAVFDTWKRVYEWVHAEFENVGTLSPTYQPEADELEQVLRGEKLPVGKDRELQKYDNLTTFALHEVGPVYERTVDRNTHLGNLNKMKKQYYAVKGSECNELLKMFYPNQFKDKPFLSYPIGQLILGIYRMWDFDQEEMHFNVDTLIECAVSGVFQNGENAGRILRKTKLFFRDAETYEEYFNRIQIIRRFIVEEPRNPRLRGLKHLSFLNLTLEECLTLEVFLKSLKDTAEKLFAGKTRGQINYVQHFNKLMDIITDAANSDDRVLQDGERQLIQEIKVQLNTNAREPVLGSLHDVSDALAFFLSSRLDKNSSNWIVRDFEQIDGAVLLSHSTNAQVYHFALLSNEHMLKQNQDELPWPLTVNVFNAYEEVKDEILAISSSVRERRSFLKFILFYGTHYSQKHVEFSYVSEEDDEQQSPYYLFTAMGYPEKSMEPDPDVGFLMNDDEEEKKTPAELACDKESVELFSICPFKFLMNKVLGADIDYVSEYHVSYFLRYYLTYLGRELHMNDPYKAVSTALHEIEGYLPFMGAAAFADLISDAGYDLKKYKDFYPDVHRRKLNFLVAGWSGAWRPVFKLTNPEKEITNYLNNDLIYPEEQQLPKHTFCDYCNYAGICLRDFYMDHDLEVEEVETTE